VVWRAAAPVSGGRGTHDFEPYRFVSPVLLTGKV